MKGANNVPVKGIDDNRQITATIAVTIGDFFTDETNLHWEDQQVLTEL